MHRINSRHARDAHRDRRAGAAGLRRPRAAPRTRSPAICAELVAHAERRGITVKGDPAAAVQELVDSKVVERFDGGTEPVYRIADNQHLVAAFYANSAVHAFVVRAIAELAQRCDDPEERGAGAARPAQVRVLLRGEGGVPGGGARRARARELPLMVAPRVLRPLLEAQLVATQSRRRRGRPGRRAPVAPAGPAAQPPTPSPPSCSTPRIKLIENRGGTAAGAGATRCAAGWSCCDATRCSTRSPRRRPARRSARSSTSTGRSSPATRRGRLPRPAAALRHRARGAGPHRRRRGRHDGARRGRRRRWSAPRSAGCAGARDEDMREFGERLWRQHIAGMVFPEARRLIRAHRRAGHTVVIATSRHALPGRAGGRRPRGRRAAVHRARGRRRRRAHRRDRRPGAVGPQQGRGGASTAPSGAASTSTQSFAYGNGDEDEDLLSCVGRPVALNPHGGLAPRRRHARTGRAPSSSPPAAASASAPRCAPAPR